MTSVAGERVLLRAAEPEEREQVHGWLHDPDVMRYNDVRYPVSLGVMRQRPGVRSGYGLVHFAVIQKERRERAGEVWLRTGRLEDRVAELGVMLGPEARGHGIGTEAVYLACRFGFEEMNLHRIELSVLAENERARRVYERIGFRIEGVKRAAFFWAGRHEDEVVMGLLRGELRSPGSAMLGAGG